MANKKKLREGYFPFDEEDRKRTKAELDDLNRMGGNLKRSVKKSRNDAAAKRKTESKHPLHPKRITNEVKYQGKRLKKLLIGK